VGEGEDTCQGGDLGGRPYPSARSHPARMRSSLRFGAALSALALLAACAGRPADPSPADPRPLELRGVWLTTVDSDILFSPEGIEEAMQRLADRGFNAVFPVVWNKGFTLYPSETMAEYFGEAYRIDSMFVASGRDPLAEVVAAARRHGMLVIPWFEFGFATSYDVYGLHLLEAYPEWTARDAAGQPLMKNGFTWMNAFDPEVQTFMLRLVEEVAAGYDVDGVQGDDRLPALPSEGGYDPYTLAEYAHEHDGAAPPADHQDPAWLQWRADRLSDFGGELYRRVKGINPDLIVSLSPSHYPWSLEEYLQDWPEWVRRGQVDMLHPQLYRYEVERYLTTLDESLETFHATEGHERVLYAPGILIKAGPRYNGPAYVRRALEEHRRRGVPGEVFFFYEGLWEENASLADSLHHRFYAAPARPWPLP
jgi:uncharacterized lipoprotein YddW (UPF0748 family)